MELYGYAGKILRIDLGSGSIKKENLDMDMAKDYLGGQGINTRLAFELIEPGIDPLSPDNPIILGAGALCGAFVISSSKLSVTTKFPLNGAIGTATACGFAPQLKWAGYDNVIVTGASEKPVYLQIFDGDVQISDASDIWGKDIFEATDALRDKHGNDISVICIGQAGEALVKISLALVDKMSHLGRGGFGAVMGSKKLKAIVVHGTQGVRIANPNLLQRIFEFVMGRALTDRNRKQWIKYGLMGVADGWIDNAIILRDNRREAPPADEAKATHGLEAWDDIVETTPWAGPSCITCDKNILRIKKGEFTGLETTASFPLSPTCIGLSLGIDVNSAMKCHDLFQRYGIDELDGTYLIDLLIDLQEKGLITSGQLGMELKRGDRDAVMKAIEKLANRDGFWDTVAEGIPGVIEKIEGASKYTIQQKGMSHVMDGRASLGVDTFGYLINPRGSQTFTLVRSPATLLPGVPTELLHGLSDVHYRVPAGAQRRIFHEERWDVARLTPYIENHNTGCNCLGLCYRFFIGRIYNVVTIAAVYSAVTGTPLTAEQFQRGGERVFNLQKALNAREGFNRKDDSFPERWITEPIKRGNEEIWLQDYTKTRRLTREDTESLLDVYYQERGWDIKKGIPTKEKLVSLGLVDVAADLEARGIFTSLG